MNDDQFVFPQGIDPWSASGHIRRSLADGRIPMDFEGVRGLLQSLGIRTDGFEDWSARRLHHELEAHGAPPEIEARVAIPGHFQAGPVPLVPHMDDHNDLHLDEDTQEHQDHQDYVDYADDFHDDSHGDSHTDSAHSDHNDALSHTDSATAHSDHWDSHEDHTDEATVPEHGDHVDNESPVHVDGAPHADSGEHYDFHTDWHGDFWIDPPRHVDATLHDDLPTTHEDFHCDYHSDHADHTDSPHGDQPQV